MQPNIEGRATTKTYAGLFLVTLSTLMLQILLTRIFSVTLWYHFAFMAVSIAMFGMTVGAVIVYLQPSRFTPERANGQMAFSALGFAVATVGSFLCYLFIPYLFAVNYIVPVLTNPHASWISSFAYFGLTYVVISIPFVFSGIVVCLALTRFPGRIGKIYAADLGGAALGCVLLIYTLEVTDAPTAVFAVAGLAAAGALFFALDSGRRRSVILAATCALMLLAFAAGHTLLVRQQAPLVRMVWVKGVLEQPPLFERWNAFSYFKVNRIPEYTTRPFGWGFSPGFTPEAIADQLVVSIDALAGTVMTRFAGDLASLEYLKHDVTNFAHYLRDDATVFVVGVGGGHDVLSALAFEQRSVLGVEINDDLIQALNGRFGAFTGHLDRNPRVTLVADEARSYVSRQKERFDIIQFSLIDTWAATTAGAFVLSENSLYTVEAFGEFLDHLEEDGILSVSRWYIPSDPTETYRLTALASAALRARGIEDPSRHVIIVTNVPVRGRRPGVGVVLASPSPFSEADLRVVREISTRLGFSVLKSPEESASPIFAELVSGRDLFEYAETFPLDISPPTDDRPFFFNVLRIRDALRTDLMRTPANDFNLKAVGTLAALLLIVAALTVVCVLVPVGVAGGRSSLRAGLPFLVFFAGIGSGFMLVEISQMQRLIVFLGHPTYSLSVVLFSLLLSSGLGSYLTPDIDTPKRARAAILRLCALLAALLLFGLLTPHASAGFRSGSTALRIAVATLMLFPLGLFMGMAFPLGMSLALRRSRQLAPWLWGVNGATSVCASVLAVAIAMAAGISAAFWTGGGCYAAALVAFLAALRLRPE